MTSNQKHAARLREMARDLLGIDEDSTDAIDMLAGAEALESTQGRWRISRGPTRDYFIPVDRWDEWCVWCYYREPGEHTAIVPEWAKPVPDGLIITGVELP